MNKRRSTSSQKMARQKQAPAFSKVGPPTQAQQNSPLLSLPAELRNSIYEYTFLLSPVELRPRKRPSNPKGRLTASGLLLACKQIHQEAMPIYYSATTFYLDVAPVSRIAEWAKSIGPLRRQLIQDIHLAESLDFAPPRDLIGRLGLDKAKELSSKVREITFRCSLEQGALKCRCWVNGAVWTEDPELLWQELSKRAEHSWTNGWVWVSKPIKRFQHLLPFATGVDKPAK